MISVAKKLSGELTSLSFVVLDDAPLDEQQGILKYRDRRGTCPAPTHTFCFETNLANALLKHAKAPAGPR